MSDIQSNISIHNSEGWRGQFERAKRWDNRLQAYNCNITDINHLHDFLDSLYATYQNIFYLKDWLYKDNILDRKSLNDFVNQNIEIGICRDIANGTKHFTLDNNFSIDKNFFIMLAHDPMNEDPYWRDNKIRIISKLGVIDPFALSKKCIALWTKFLNEKNIIEADVTTLDDLQINTEYNKLNTQKMIKQKNNNY